MQARTPAATLYQNLLALKLKANWKEIISQYETADAKDIEEGLKDIGTRSEYLMNVGIAYASLQKYQQAEKIYDQVASLLTPPQPALSAVRRTLAENYYNLALSYEKIKQKTEQNILKQGTKKAVEMIEKAISFILLEDVESLEKNYGYGNLEAYFNKGISDYSQLTRWDIVGIFFIRKKEICEKLQKISEVKINELLERYSKVANEYEKATLDSKKIERLTQVIGDTFLPSPSNEALLSHIEKLINLYDISNDWKKLIKLYEAIFNTIKLPKLSVGRARYTMLNQKIIWAEKLIKCYEEVQPRDQKKLFALYEEYFSLLYHLPDSVNELGIFYDIELSNLKDATLREHIKSKMAAISSIVSSTGVSSIFVPPDEKYSKRRRVGDDKGSAADTSVAPSDEGSSNQTPTAGTGRAATASASGTFFSSSNPAVASTVTDNPPSGMGRKRKPEEEGTSTPTPNI